MLSFCERLQFFQLYIPADFFTDRALRAMIAEFVFFIGIAAVCFSGILLTLYTLGKLLVPLD
jgi:hypothetical protein